MFTVHYEYLMEISTALMDGHIKYGMGKKAQLHAEPSEIKAIDCSGFTRYLMHKVSDGRIKMVDGSNEQNAWCKKKQLQAERYNQASVNDNLLRIAFIPRVYKDGKVVRAGHVWLILNGETLESHGKDIGPDRRPWDTPVLKNRVKTCYVLARLYSMTMGPVTIKQA